MAFLKLKPSCKDYLWGGTRLRTEFGIEYDRDPLAESWELSCHPDGPSYIVNGEYAGKTLQQYIDENGKEILGTDCQSFGQFPVLIKFIDAKKDLSIQVHPDNAYALKNEGQYGKTEMWYVMDAAEGASLFYGFAKEVSEEEFEERIRNHTLTDVLNKVMIHKGDVLFIDPGTIHAIGAGSLIAEIQQNSNTTYRVYDYNRLGVDGKPRELHTEKALDVTKCEPPKNNGVMPPVVKKDGYDEKHLTSCELFSVKDVTVNKSYSSVADSNSFVSILVIDGNGSLICENETFPLCKGDSYFISADSGEFKICGNVNLIETRV